MPGMDNLSIYKFIPHKPMMLVINGLNPPAGCHISDKNWVNYGTKKDSDEIAVFFVQNTDLFNYF